MARIHEIFDGLSHKPISEILLELGLQVDRNARTTLSDWSWQTPTGRAFSMWIDDTSEEEGMLRQRFNVKRWAKERAKSTLTANRALRYDQALRAVHYMPDRAFHVILLEADRRRGLGGWTEASVASRKALDAVRWRIVDANPEGDWTVERLVP